MARVHEARGVRDPCLFMLLTLVATENCRRVVKGVELLKDRYEFGAFGHRLRHGSVDPLAPSGQRHRDVSAEISKGRLRYGFISRNIQDSLYFREEGNVYWFRGQNFPKFFHGHVA